LTVANLNNNLAVALTTLGRHAEAERVFREAFAQHVSLLGESHWRTRNLARNIGKVLQLQQRDEDALSWLDQAVASQTPGKPPEDAGFMGIRAQRTMVLFRLGRSSSSRASPRSSNGSTAATRRRSSHPRACGSPAR
jgi:hypothetical protein